MPYVITELCTNDGSCVDVCPVACIHTTPGAPQFYIDPEVCIDCEQCEIVCPVDAIFVDHDLPAEHKHSLEVNASFFRQNKPDVGPVPMEKAWEMVNAAHTYANKEGMKVAVAVVDEAGCPIALGTMDGVNPRTAEHAFHKAYTAAAFHVPTEELVPQARQAWLRSLMISHHGRITPTGGGIVIVDGVAIIGGIGVAGGTRAEHDTLCCRVALAVWENSGH